MNKTERNQILKEGKPKVSESSLEEYIQKHRVYDEAMNLMIQEIYPIKEMKEVFKMSDKIGKLEESTNDEEEYTRIFYEELEKANKMLASAVTEREEKIKKMKEEIIQLENFSYGVNRSFDCLRIRFEIEIRDKIKKGEVVLGDED